MSGLMASADWFESVLGRCYARMPERLYRQFKKIIEKQKIETFKQIE
jgi:hypothetical protein